jgi:hypothetical protein
MCVSRASRSGSESSPSLERAGTLTNGLEIKTTVRILAGGDSERRKAGRQGRADWLFPTMKSFDTLDYYYLESN